MEERLIAHSAFFSSMAKMLPPLVIKEEEDDEGVSEEPSTDKKFSVERVRSISLAALQERLKEKINSTSRKRKNVEIASEVPPKKKKMDKSKGKKSKGKRQDNKETSKSKTKGHSDDNEDRPSKPSFVDESGRVVFSKFDFSSSAQKETQGSEKESKKKKDYKSLLAKAEAAQKKLEELKKTDEKRGNELAKKLMWQKAMDMARGTKVKDDPKMLKRTVKSIDKKKKKSSMKWEERKKGETEAMEKRQAKRKANIDERRGLIHSKKLKKRIKKGKGRTPGF